MLVILFFTTTSYNVDIVKYEIEIEAVDTTDIVINSLETDIENYFSINYPKAKISPREIARVCVEYELEPKFVLSQAHLESHYGTRGRAKSTNSIFNVGAWDDGTTKNYYASPDASIEPYAKLLTQFYLIDGKTIDDLLRPGGFVNHNGHRYATAKNYEFNIKWLITYIEERSDIKTLLEYYESV